MHTRCHHPDSLFNNNKASLHQLWMKIMINPVQLACLYHLFWYHFWPALMSFLMVLESRFWGGALFSATAGLPTQWAHSCWWLSNIKGWTLGKLQQKHVFKSDNRNNLALTTTHLSLWAGYTDPPAPRKDLEQKMKSQRSAWKFSWKEWRRHQKNAPPPHTKFGLLLVTQRFRPATNHMPLTDI